jgi:hypothetical protein
MTGVAKQGILLLLDTILGMKMGTLLPQLHPALRGVP